MKKYKIGDECIIYTPYLLEYHLKKCEVTGYGRTMYTIKIHGQSQGKFGSDEILIKINSLKAMVFKRKGKV